MKRLLAILLAFVMVLSLYPVIPTTASAAEDPKFTTYPVGGSCTQDMTLTVTWATNFTPVKQLLVKTVYHPVDGAVKTRTPLDATATSVAVGPGYYTILAYYSDTEYISDDFTINQVSRGTELIFTDDAMFESGTRATIDIEAMAEQDETLMEAYLMGGVIYRWIIDGQINTFANGVAYDFTDADVGKSIQAAVYYDDYMSVSDSYIVEEAHSIWVGGVRMTDGTYLANGAESVSLDQPDRGYAHYKNGTLTLNNYVYEGEGGGYPGRISDYLIYTATPLYLELIGSSSLTQTKLTYASCIYTEKDMTVFGDGDLEISGGSHSLYSQQSIYIYGGTISGSNVNYGIHSVDDLYIYGGNISVTGRYCGLFSYADIYIEGGNLDIISTAEYKNDDYCAISSDSINFARNMSVLAATEPNGTFVEYNPADNATYGHIRITPKPEVWVGGVGMFEGDYLASGAYETTTEEPEGGYAYYSDGILFLRDYAYEGEGYTFETVPGTFFGAAVYSETELDVYLEGENTLNQTVPLCSIYCEEDLYIEGPGSLYSTQGIYSQAGDIWIEGATLTASELDVDINALNGSVYINGGTVNHSIRACYDIEVAQGKVNAVSNYAALDAGRNITIYGGSVTAKTTHAWPDEENSAIEYGTDFEGSFTVMDALVVRASADPDGVLSKYNADEHNTYDLIVIAEPCFTKQPQSGQVTGIRDLLTVEWETNFEPLRIEVYELFADEEMLHSTLPGTATSVELTATAEGYYLVAYYSDSIPVESDRFQVTIGESATVYFCDGDSILDAQSVLLGQCAKEPEAPYQDGVTFLGWYTAEGELYDFSTPVTEDLYLYAKFGHYVIFCFGETPIAGQPVFRGACAVEPDPPAQEGMTFLGWYTADGELYDFSAPVTEDIYLYAKFGHYVYLCFGDTPIAAQGVEHGHCANEPEPPAQEGMTFLGWYTADGKLYDFSTPVTEDIYLYAKFEEEAAENPFTDVPEGSFYYEPVLWAVENGITTGASATTFNPNGQCQRAVVVTFLWRAAGKPEPKAVRNPFVDVKESDFFYKAVLWAVEEGITNGSDANHFNPYGVCNRAQVVTFLHRAMGSPAPNSMELPFTDVPAGSWYAAPVAWAVQNGITNGISATEFGPNAACNRAQVVTFLYRAYN